jgi:hypothetical protein
MMAVISRYVEFGAIGGSSHDGTDDGGRVAICYA